MKIRTLIFLDLWILFLDIYYDVLHGWSGQPNGYTYTSAVEREEGSTIPGARRSGSLERGPGPNCVAQVFLFLISIIIYRLHKLLFQGKPKSLCNWKSDFPI